MRWILPLVVSFATSCVVAPRLVIHDDDSDRIERDLQSESFNPDLPALRGIALGTEAPPLAPPFPETSQWQRYLPARGGSLFGGRSCVSRFGAWSNARGMVSCRR